MKDLAQRRTVLFSTHVIPWVEAVCERVIVIDRGRIAADGRISELSAGLDGGLEERFRLLTDTAEPARITAGDEEVRP